jgi:hypothetical protein
MYGPASGADVSEEQQVQEMVRLRVWLSVVAGD